MAKAIYKVTMRFTEENFVTASSKEVENSAGWEGSAPRATKILGILPTLFKSWHPRGKFKSGQFEEGL
jgi:hypothetical protein